MRCILFGGSGQVGGAVARALIQSERCTQLTLLGRRAVASVPANAKVQQIVVDTAAADFEQQVRDHARGHDVGISCLGVGSGTGAMTEAQMAAVEVDLVSRFARGCKAAGIEIFELLTAVGVDERSAGSRVKYLRVMGKKFLAVREVGFERLAVFKPGVIVGNAHTPRWMTWFTRLVPDSLGWGNIAQDELARAFVAHLEQRAPTQQQPVVSYENAAMKALLRSGG